VVHEEVLDHGHEEVVHEEVLDHGHEEVVHEEVLDHGHDDRAPHALDSHNRKLLRLRVSDPKKGVLASGARPKRKCVRSESCSVEALSSRMLRWVIRFRVPHFQQG
jgi:hypothetical protein